MPHSACLNRTIAEELLPGLQDRDPELIGRLIDTYGGRLFRYLILLTGNRHVAEDIFQETWVRVIERGHQFRRDCSFQAWLFSIARHLIIDHARQKKAVSLESLLEDDVPLDNLKAAGPSALDRLCEQEQAECLDSQVRSLPTHHREIFELRLGDELKLAEIAQATGVPLSTVKSRLYRAAALLQTRLAPEREISVAPCIPG